MVLLLKYQIRMRLKHQLSEHIANKLSTLKAKNICVGLSGGIDSVVLLHTLKHLEPKIDLTAVHIHHNISPHATAWLEFCQRFCDHLQVSLYTEKINLKRSGGESLENIARVARHKILLQNKAEVIALAHHQNDQVETVLSQLFRGSDLHNIAAMHEISYRQEKILWRPLLQISKAQIEEYASLFKLEYITDESNFDTKYLRNFVRHDVLPLLTNWDNNIIAKILNFNGQLQRLLAVTDEVGANDLDKCCIHGSNINLELFKNLSNIRQINSLSQFIKTNNLALPGNKQLIEFVKQAVTSSWDSKPQLKLGSDTLLIKYKNNIFISSK